jgi:hypothetical protein
VALLAERRDGIAAFARHPRVEASFLHVLETSFVISGRTRHEDNIFQRKDKVQFVDLQINFWVKKGSNCFASTHYTLRNVMLGITKLQPYDN